MFRHFRVAKLVEGGDFDRLLSEVQMNTRQLPLAVRVRVSSEGVLETCAVGLALRRLTEVSYVPEPPVERLISRLIELQAQDGGFGEGSPEATITASAIALGALRAVQRQVAALPGSRVGMRFLSAGLDEQIEEAVGRGLAWLGEKQARSAVGREFDRRFGHEHSGGLLGDEIDSAVVLWQLGDDARAAAALDLDGVLHGAMRAGLSHHRDTASIMPQETATSEAVTAMKPVRGSTRRAA